jgi:hypothetical protein
VAWRERRDIAEIEKDRPPLELHLDIDGRIAGAAVDEMGMKERAHGRH